MKTQNDDVDMHEGDDLQAHYDFDYSKAKPNRFAERIKQESRMIVLDPDVADAFPTSEAVNETLRMLMVTLQKIPTAKSRQEQSSLPV